MGYDITQLWVGGHRVGLMGLKNAFTEVQALGLKDHEIIKNEIIKRLRKLNYIPAEAEADYAKALILEYRRFLGEQVDEESAVVEIRILGPGCARCDDLMNRVMTALAELKLQADVQHIRDLKQVAQYGPVLTPALVVNGKVKVAGKVPTVEQLKNMLA